MSKLFKFLSGTLLLVALVSAQGARAASADEIDADVQHTLKRFAREIGGGQEFLDSAKGLLVFPKIYKGGIVIGGEYGEGALLAGGKTLDYYRSAGVSLGFQWGAQAKSVVVAFMTPDALEKFRASTGWKVGVDGSVALVDMGAGKSLDSKTIKDPVVGFIFDQKGLMYNLTLEGSKFEKLDKR